MTRRRGNSHTINSERDEMIRAILKTSLSPMLDELRERYSMSVSEPVLIGEDKVGLIFYAEGHIPLFWDSPLLELNNRIKEVPSLIERQPLITGHDGIPEKEESEEFEESLNNIHLFAEALVHVIR